jgi:nicotinamide riboside kinase
MPRFLYPALLLLVFLGSVLLAAGVPAFVDGYLRSADPHEQREALRRQCQRELKRLEDANRGIPEENWNPEERRSLDLVRHHLRRLGENP